MALMTRDAASAHATHADAKSSRFTRCVMMLVELLVVVVVVGVGVVVFVIRVGVSVVVDTNRGDDDMVLRITVLVAMTAVGRSSGSAVVEVNKKKMPVVVQGK